MANNTKKKSNFSFRRLIYNDKYLIIISLILAVIVWIVASINIGTDETKTIKLNVPITLGDELSEQYEMEYYALQDNIELSVTISGPKYVIGQVTENDLSVNFDSSSVSRTGIQSIPILVTNSSRTLDFDVTNTYPSSLEAFFDVSATRSMDVDVVYNENCIADGYVFGKPVVDHTVVLVSGPQTYVDKIESIYAEVKLDENEKLTKQYKADCQLQVKGLGVESSYLYITAVNDLENKLSNVTVTLPVLKETVLPVSVEYENAPIDEQPNGITRTVFSVNELNVGVLGGADVKSAVIGKVDYAQLKAGRNDFEFKVSKMKGITVLDDVETISVSIYYNPRLVEKTTE